MTVKFSSFSLSPGLFVFFSFVVGLIFGQDFVGLLLVR